MIRYILLAFVLFSFVGCATWSGIKEDTKTGVDWTKKKVHEGAVYIEKKTQ